ncbi:hypothetical protein [Hymenobacter volaticus]|uniref:hypothetical protein n=1 Tax=Hymenobacter volaticus TaxID=2932254 RepID=UPI001FD6BC1A|nr:hypothetical protein [Hymenobacter volaticus]
MPFPEPTIPLVYLSPPRSYAGRYALVAPRIGESMGGLLRQVRQLPGYKYLWLGTPASVPEIRARAG